MEQPKTFQEKSLTKKQGPKVNPMTFSDWVAVAVFVFVGSLAFKGIYSFFPTPAPETIQNPVVEETIKPDNVFDPTQGISTLVIKGERWEVRPVAFGWFQGQTNCESRIIWFDKTASRSRENERDVMWHEIQHAASKCQHSLSDEEANWVQDAKADNADYPQHRVIYKRAAFLTEFVHDNPEFMKWAEDWK